MSLAKGPKVRDALFAASGPAHLGRGVGVGGHYRIGPDHPRPLARVGQHDEAGARVEHHVARLKVDAGQPARLQGEQGFQALNGPSPYQLDQSVAAGESPRQFRTPCNCLKIIHSVARSKF